MAIRDRVAQRWRGRVGTPFGLGTAYKEANAARDARDWPEASARFAALVARFPLEAAAWVQLGHALKESGQLAEAEKAYLHALQLQPGTADTELHLFHLQKTIRSRLTIAGHDAGEAMQGHNAVAELHDLTQDRPLDWAGQVDRYARILSADPGNFPSWVQYGHALKESGLRASAEEAYQTAIALRPDDPDAHLQFGHLQKLMGRRPAALRSYRTAVALDPDLGDARAEIEHLTRQGGAAAGQFETTDAPVFVIRGDIVSSTGYAKAARAMARLLAERYVVLGLCIHDDPSDRSAVFPGHLVSEDDVVDLAARTPVVVINHTTPDHFVPFPLARNIAAFYWETSAQPRHLRWAERLSFADAVWSPTRFVTAFVRGCGYGGPVSLVPWAHEVRSSSHAEAGRAGTPALHISCYDRLGAGETGSLAPFASVRRQSGTIYLAVQSLAPRKGLPLLLAGWREHVEATPEGDDFLLLKLSFRHAHGIGDAGAPHFETILRSLGLVDGRPLRLGLLDADLSEAGMAALYGTVDCYVTMTLGEGFGGPVIEALSARLPVIAPAHTGIRDLLAPDYPLTIATSEQYVALMDNMTVYPSGSSWHVPDPGSLPAAIARFAAMNGADRRAMVERAVDHAEAFCGVAAVREALAAAVGQIETAPRA